MNLLPVLLIVLLAVPGMVHGQESDENADRRLQEWREAPSPEVYLRSLQTAGLLDRTSSPATPSWYSIGPLGTFSGRNGRVANVQILPAAGGYTIYAAASTGGIWKTASSNPPSWIALGDRLPNLSVRGLAVNPSNPNDILAGTGDYTRPYNKGAGLFRTLNGGATWTMMTLPGGIPEDFYRIAYVPGSPGDIVAACSNGIYQSLDGGTTWALRYGGHATDLLIHPTIPTIQYACVMNVGVVESIDGGSTWTLLNAITSPFGRASIALCASTPASMAVIVESSDSLQGIFKTDNQGANWSNITGSLVAFGGDQIDHTCSIAIRPNNPNEIYVGAVTVAGTTDNGASWQGNLLAEGHGDITQLYFSDVTGPDVLWITNDGGIYRHTFGGSTDDWNGVGVNGLVCTQIDFMDARRDFKTIGNQDNGIVRSTDNGTSWEFIGGGDGYGTTITDDRNYDFWYSDGQHANPVQWTWKRPRNSGSIRIGNNLDENEYQFWHNTIDGNVYVAAGTKLLTAPAASANPSWTFAVSLPIDGVHLTYGSPLDGNTMYVTTDGASQPVLMVLRRAGPSWSVATDTLPGNGFVRAVHVSGEAAGEAWAGLNRPDDEPATSPQLYHTLDYGQTWTQVTDAKLQGPGYIRSLVVKPLYPNEIYVGTRIGVFYTNDGGANWTPFQNGMPIIFVTGLKYIVNPAHNGTDYLVASTFGRGMWQCNLPTSPLSFVDLNATGFSDGTFDYPYQTFNAGIAGTPQGGTVGLRGNTYTLGPSSFSSPIIFKAYGGTAIIR